MGVNQIGKVYSTTKYIGGHGTSIGGMLVDGGNLDWTEKPDRQPLLNEPDPSYHGAVWGTLIPEALGAPIAYCARRSPGEEDDMS